MSKRGVTRQEKSQVRASLFLVVFMLLVPTVLVAGYASNITGEATAIQAPEPIEAIDMETESAGPIADIPVAIPETNASEPQEQPGETDKCRDVTCQDSELTCPDGYQATCSNACDHGTGECSGCLPDCSDHQKDVANGTSNENGTAIPENGTHLPGNETHVPANETQTPSNGTQPPSNETQIPSNGTQPYNETNATTPGNSTCIEDWECGEWSACTGGFRERECTDLNECGTDDEKPPETEGCTQEEPQPIIDIQLILPNKVTRGKEYEFRAIIDNTGSGKAKKLNADWVLPEGITLLKEENDCSSLKRGEYCMSLAKVRIEADTIGLKDVKVVVSYA